MDFSGNRSSSRSDTKEFEALWSLVSGLVETGAPTYIPSSFRAGVRLEDVAFELQIDCTLPNYAKNICQNKTRGCAPGGHRPSRPPKPCSKVFSSTASGMTSRRSAA